MAGKRIAFVAADFEEAQEALARLRQRYGTVAEEEADVVVALGGDGFMLRTLHRLMDGRVPVYGMNRGSVGFLMNTYGEDDLAGRLDRAEPIRLFPLAMEAEQAGGERCTVHAINEVSLLRETGQAAKLRITIDGVVRIEEMVADGVLIATPAGSTAYNMSAYGPILPLGSAVLALTPISAHRPRRWRGAILPHKAVTTFDVIHPRKRPVSAVADYTEVRDVLRVTVREDRSLGPILLYDPEHNLEERILGEQFIP